MQDALVSIDAIASSADTAEKLIDKKADYLLALKKNQKTIFEQVEDWFSKHKEAFDSHIWQDFGSGRIEKRVCYVCSNIEMIESLQSWKGVKSIIMVEASREKSGKIGQETRYYCE